MTKMSWTHENKILILNKHLNMTLRKAKLDTYLLHMYWVYNFLNDETNLLIYKKRHLRDVQLRDMIVISSFVENP